MCSVQYFYITVVKPISNFPIKSKTFRKTKLTVTANVVQLLVSFKYLYLLCFDASNVVLQV